MMLYKYKAGTPFEHIADILINERLYCAPYYRMNDPFEGVFRQVLEFEGVRYSTLSTPDDVMDPEVEPEPRVCSLSSTSSSVLLWSFYAQRMEGVCFEIDCNGLKPVPLEVSYPREMPRFDEPGFVPSVNYALAHKMADWQFEQEYRLIGVDACVSIKDRLRKLILGPRCNQTLGLAIQKLAPIGCKVTKANLSSDARAVVL